MPAGALRTAALAAAGIAVVAVATWTLLSLRQAKETAVPPTIAARESTAAADPVPAPESNRPVAAEPTASATATAVLPVPPAVGTTASGTAVSGTAVSGRNVSRAPQPKPRPAGPDAVHHAAVPAREPAPAAAAVKDAPTAKTIAPAARDTAALAGFLTDGDCLDPSVFARILVCEAKSSPVVATAATNPPPVTEPPATTAPNERPPAASGPAASPVAGALAQSPDAASDRPAELVTFVRPSYPDAAKQAAVTGAVEVDVVIDGAGRVVVSTAVSGHALLRGAAEAALQQWRFRPAYLGGRPVASRRRFLVSFAAVPNPVASTAAAR